MFLEIFDSFLYDEIISIGYSRKTEERYIVFSRLITKFFGNIEISRLDEKKVREWREYLAKYQSPDTVRGYVICLRKFIRYCERRFDIEISAENIKVPRREKRKIDILTNEEVIEFINAISEKRRGYSEVNRLRNIAIAKLIYCSGLRVGEVCKLNKNSIKNRQMTIVGKSLEPRLCFINRDTELAIHEYLNARNDIEPALFISNQNGKRITESNIQRIFQRVCENSNGKFEKVHPHTLRHCFATSMLDRGVDIVYIQDFMGHQSLDTTKIYTHYSNNKLREVYEKANI